MIAIEIELLTGRYVATSFDDRARAEWPPHPSRLFSALVATAAEQDRLDGAERSALEWLEAQGPPRILASAAEPRTVLPCYVAENTTRVVGDWSKQERDAEAAAAALAEAERRGEGKATLRLRKALDKATKKLDDQVAKATRDDGAHNPSACAKALEMLPAHRGKQPRMLPSVTPHLPRVHYLWSDATPDSSITTTLSELARGVVRLGHASSLVACRIHREPPDDASDFETWIPTDGDGDAMLRSVEAGQLVNLERAHARHLGIEPRVLPARHQRYRRPTTTASRTDPVRSVFDEWLVLREIAPVGRRLGIHLSRTEDVTRALRGALLHHADDPAPAMLSGHALDGRPLDSPHVAFVALGDTVSRHASGAVLGAAILLPRVIQDEDRAAVLRAIGRWQNAGMQLRLGRAGVMHLERIVDRDPRTTLSAATWTRPSRRWASVTPVALDENPGDLLSRDPAVAAVATERAEALVARACERIGLPPPRWVEIMRRSLFLGAPSAQRFTPFPRKGNGFKRVCVHVELAFAERIAGPVLLGAGRYYGLGLCRAVQQAPRRQGAHA